MAQISFDKESKFSTYDNPMEFALYVEAHYLPFLARIQQGNLDFEDNNDAKLAGFLRADLEELCKQIEAAD